MSNPQCEIAFEVIRGDKDLKLLHECQRDFLSPVLFCRFVKIYSCFFNHRLSRPCDPATTQTDISGAGQMQSQ